ncbi:MULTISPECIES: DUF1150 family protein [Alphaproteobacteria]|jgi:hypothetical protein|uniref:DUF1150 family protein n=1 Tax=Pyruvatibacter mobilis TaxID=1712261 RepID=A0A845Q9X1_9HYPH|nr:MULTISPECIES: DUF1150 domain-containing protein [Alphaproteobacteria]NBG94891.1 DUF1150 family protein [Pyruvatibacter mobilis]QJD76108.1 DUF1150 family protein [Pyruvatibacter mobilis]GGD21227.1 hypothetical protein GCM10011587_27320 [Pyruvatibacter mobilis]
MNDSTFDTRAPAPMMSSKDFAEFGAPKTVYVREIGQDDVREVVGEDTKIPHDARFFAVHSANGTRMAIVDDRDAAFAGARQYDLDPVSVH